MSPSEYGLVLSGGGAKGAFEMGVWKALRECDYPIGAVIGTSVGAINAAIIAQNDFDVAMEFWSNITIHHVLQLSKNMTNNSAQNLSSKSFDIFWAGFIDILFSNGLDVTPLRNNLTRLISEKAVRESSIRFGLVTVDVTSLKPKQLMIEDIPQGRLIDYLLASAALPIFQKQEIDGNTYIDGCFFDNVPINFMLKQDFKRIISVEFPAPGIRKYVWNKNVEIITVNNSQLLGGVMNFGSKNIGQNIQLGYLDAMKTFGALAGKHYYLDTQDHHAIFEKFQSRLGMPLSDINRQQKLTAFLNLPEDTDEIGLLDGLNNLLKKTTFRNQPLGLSLLEITGKSLGVSRMKDYPIDYFFPVLLTQLHVLLEGNLNLLTSSKVIRDFLSSGNNNFRRYHFIIFYIIFLSIEDDLAPENLKNFFKKFTPDITLSIITLFYIHEMLKH